MLSEESRSLNNLLKQQKQISIYPVEDSSDYAADDRKMNLITRAKSKEKVHQILLDMGHAAEDICFV